MFITGVGEIAVAMQLMEAAFVRNKICRRQGALRIRAFEKKNASTLIEILNEPDNGVRLACTKTLCRRFVLRKLIFSRISVYDYILITLGIEGDAEVWNARFFLYQLRSDKTGTRGAFDGTREEAYSGANREPAAAG